MLIPKSPWLFRSGCFWTNPPPLPRRSFRSSGGVFDAPNAWGAANALRSLACPKIHWILC